MTNPWKLTPQEQQSVDLTACGLSLEKIAKQMGVSTKTVQIYRSLAMDKMGCARNVPRAAVLWDRFAMGRDEAVDHSEEARAN